MDKRFYMDNPQLEGSEFELIRSPQRGVRLYKCGNERYLPEVHAPPHKAELFGKAGGIARGSLFHKRNQRAPKGAVIFV